MEETPAWLVRVQELLSVYGLKVLAALATLIIGAIATWSWFYLPLVRFNRDEE